MRSCCPAVVLWLFAANVLSEQVQFVEVTESAGIRWQHQNGATAEKFLIETMGGGAAFLDFDRDGWLDLYLVNSGPHAHSPGKSKVVNALYRNNGDGTFRNVTQRAGVEGQAYGMGVAVGDYDNDGWPDIYVTNFGPDILYRNRGDGTFEDMTAKAGLQSNRWSTSAAFFDLENDGDLDLFVCVYLDWDFDKNVYCGDRREDRRSYCHPDYFQPISSLLFENRGNGTFVEVSKSSGVHLPGKALGVVTGDVNDDGLSDLYVANDAVANHLFLSLGKGKFEESALISEVAYGITARPESGMGTDLGDFNGDGRVDLVVTNIDYEMNNVYANQGDGFFDDVTISAQLGEVALPYSGFGVRWLDYDNDGDLDLVVLNGHVVDNIHYYKSGIEYAEPPLLLENQGGKFKDVGSAAGPIWQRKLVGRALAVGDYDNDGDPDLLFVNNNQPPVLLRNEGGSSRDWLGVHLVGSASNRDAVGARVTVKTDTRSLVRERHGGGSYQAAHDPRLVFGFESGEKIEKIWIRWPSGRKQELGPLDLRRYHTLQEPLDL